MPVSRPTSAKAFRSPAGQQSIQYSRVGAAAPATTKEFIFNEPPNARTEIIRDVHRIQQVDAFGDRPHGHPRRTLPVAFMNQAQKIAAATMAASIPDKRIAGKRTAPVVTPTPKFKSPKLRERPKSALERVTKKRFDTDGSLFGKFHREEAAADAAAAGGAPTMMHSSYQSRAAADGLASSMHDQNSHSALDRSMPLRVYPRSFDPRTSLHLSARDQTLTDLGLPLPTPEPVPVPVSTTVERTYDALQELSDELREAVFDAAPGAVNERGRRRSTWGETLPEIGPGLDVLLAASVADPFCDQALPNGTLIVRDVLMHDLTLFAEERRRMEKEMRERKAKREQQQAQQRGTSPERSQSPPPRPWSASRSRPQSAKLVRPTAAIDATAPGKQRPQSAQLTRKSVVRDRARPQSAGANRQSVPPRPANVDTWADRDVLASASAGAVYVPSTFFVSRKLRDMRYGGGFQENPFRRNQRLRDQASGINGLQGLSL